MLTLAPDYEIIERNFSQYARNEVEYSVGFIITADYGECLKPIDILEEGDLLDFFGKPTKYNYQDWYQIWNFLQYVPTGKVKAQVVRAIDPSKAYNVAKLIKMNDNQYQKLYVFSGHNGTNVIDNFYKIDLEENIINENTTATGIPSARENAAVCSYIDEDTHKVYVFIAGGYDGTNRLNDFYMYDVYKNEYITLANLPIALEGAQLFYYNNKVYLVGGYDGTNYLNTIYVYDVENNTWETATTVLPTALSNFGLTRYNDNVFIYGGRVDATTLSDALYTWNLSTNAITLESNSGNAVEGINIVFYNNKIYVFGGYDGTNYLNTISYYDLDNDVWNTSTVTLSHSLSEYAIAVDDSKVYIIGGRDDLNYYNTIDIYDLENDEITTSSITLSQNIIKSVAWIANTYKLPEEENTEYDSMYNLDVATYSLSNMTISSKLAIINRYVTSDQRVAVAICSSKEFWDKPIAQVTKDESGNPVRIFTQDIQGIDYEILKWSDLFEYEPNWNEDEFLILVFNKNEDDLYELVEKFHVSYKENAKDFTGGNMFAEEVIRNKSKYIYLKVGPEDEPKVDTSMWEIRALQHSSENTIYPRIGTWPNTKYSGQYTQADIQYAQEIFENMNLYSNVLLVAHYLDINGMSRIAETKQDCMAIVPFYDWDEIINKKTSEAVDIVCDKLGTKSLLPDFHTFGSYSFIVGDVKYQYDKFNDVNRWIALGGDVAGIIMRSFVNSYPWEGFAGIPEGKVLNVIKLAINPNKKAYRDKFFVNSINPVIHIEGEGAGVLYGMKTAVSEPSMFDMATVRLTLNYTKAAIAKILPSFLFKINDEFTRARAVAAIDPILRNIYALRGFRYYKLICDESNNPAHLVDQGYLIIDINILPASFVRYVSVRLNIMSSGMFEILEQLAG